MNAPSVLLLVIAATLPNLMPLFIKGPSLESITLTSLGIFFTLVGRDAFRILDTESGYLNNFVSMNSAPFLRLRQVCRHAIRAFLGNALRSLVVLIILLAAYPTQWNDMRNSLDADLIYAALPGVLAAIVAGSMFCYGFGLICSSIPLLNLYGKEHPEIHIATPLLPIVLSGFYIPLSELPRTFQIIAYANPLTYVAKLLDTTQITGNQWLALISLLQGLAWLVGGYCIQRLSFYIRRKANRTTELNI